jgi:hypothetical protein
MQPVAISGKWNGPRNRENKRKPLPWIATGCVRRSMVRRGSTVRVRQRASAYLLLTAFSVVREDGHGRFRRPRSVRASDGPRSPSSSPRQMLPSERSRARCSSASRSPASPSSPTRASPGRVRGLDGRSPSRVPSSRSRGQAAPIRIARARAPVDRISTRTRASVPRVGLLDLQGTARPRAPRRARTPGPVRPRRAAAPRPRRRAPA